MGVLINVQTVKTSALMMLRYQKDGISTKNKCIRISNCGNMGGTVPDETSVHKLVSLTLVAIITISAYMGIL
ncbi:MAG: hypothetical protein WBX01_15385 [Nitrososphaeraceae archaeon]